MCTLILECIFHSTLILLQYYMYISLTLTICKACPVIWSKVEDKNIYYVIATNSNSVPEVHDMWLSNMINIAQNVFLFIMIDYNYTHLITY